MAKVLKTAALFLTVVIIVVLVSENQNRLFRKTDDIRSVSEWNLNQATLHAKMKLKKRQDGQAGKRAKPDQPDLFAEFHKSIRTRDGESEPAYPLNYKMTELQKARQLHTAPAVTLPWQARGPGNVGGRTRGIIVDPDDPTHNTWFAGSVGGGVWKTTDAGASWVNKSPELPNLATTVLAMAESNHDIIYAGTGEGFFNADAVAGDGIWKSSDRGETWTQLSSTASNPDFKYVNRIVIDPANAEIVVSVTNTGIFRSTDGGSNWTMVFTAGHRFQDLIANPQNFNTLFASENNIGVLRSKDGGKTWQLVKSMSSPGRIELAMAPNDTTRVYAAAQNPSSRLYMSTDAGDTWNVVNEQSGGAPNWLGSQGWYDNAITVSPFDADLVFVGGINIYKIQVLPGNQRVTTRLTNWYPGTGYPFVHADQHNLTPVIINPATQSFRLVNGNDGGVEYSDDGGITWHKTLNGYNTTQFYGVDKKHGSSEYIGGMQDNGTWRSTANPNMLSPWLNQLGGDGFDVSWHYTDPNKIIGSVQFNSFYRSLDGGITWEPATSGMSDVGSGAGIFISAIAKSQSDPDLLFAVGVSGIWRSDNFADDWTLTTPAGFWGYNGLSGQVKISRANPQIVWAGNSMNSSNRVHVSTDGGLTFTPTNNYTAATLGRITGMDTHPTQDSTAYVTFSIANAPKILRTTDLGQTWEDISGFGSNPTSNNGFPDVATYCVLVMPHTPDTLWAGTEIGLFESTDNGANWHLADNGLPAASIWDMRVVDDQVVVATHGRGIWSVTIPELLNAPPPVVTLSPRLNRLAQAPQGDLNIDIALRSVYDSTRVILNGQKYLTIFNSAPLDTILQYPVTQSGTVTVSLTAYKDGKTYKSAQRSASVILFSAPQVTYLNNFNTPSNDFVGTGFSVITPSGFNDPAIHTAHSYSNNLDISYTLIVPIIVASSNADIKFDEIAVVEPGDPGSVFGDPDFWDYVIVEGTRDGIQWIQLEDGYDARYDAGWLNAYYQGSPGTPALFKTHQMNLLNVFSPGEQILLRLRLFADGAVTGWGWAVDNLRIQEGASAITQTDFTPNTFRLFDNFPNPFNPTTLIRFQVPGTSHVQLKIYNSLGQEVRTLVNRNQAAGTQSVVWDGRNNAGNSVASGIYYYRLQAGNFVQVKKMMLLR